MTGFAGDWATSQLAEFLVAVGDAPDEAAALGRAVERATEILEGEHGAAVAGDEVLASVGFAAGRVPVADLVALARDGRGARAPAWAAPDAAVAVAALDDERGTRLVVVRSGGGECAPPELHLLRAMARGLSQTLRTLRLLHRERAARGEAERYLASLCERQRLLERLSRIQRSISHRMPLPETLDAVTAAAAELIGDEVVGLRLLDPDEPGWYVLASSTGVAPDVLPRIRRGPLGEGAGGRAMTENRLVVVEDYGHASNVVAPLAESGLAAAMAAPVHENGRVIGSLVVASYVVGRRYSQSEQEALLAFAEHASLALSDARNHAAMLDAQRAQDEFVAAVSHELKTPLTVVMAALRTMQQHGGALPAATARTMLEIAHARGRDLEMLIEHLLRAARAELAGFRQSVEVPLLVASAVAGSPHLHRVRLGALPGAGVVLDVAAFREALALLVDHAVAGAPADADVLIDGAVDGAHLRVAVGVPGATAEAAGGTPYLPLPRGSRIRPEPGGVGLRLYLAVRLAESMGGTVTTEPGEAGGRYALRVPRGAAAPVVVDPETAVRSA